MKPCMPYCLWPLLLGLPLACGAADSDAFGPLPTRGSGFEEAIDAPSTPVGTQRAPLAPTIFPGGGTSGAALPLSPALAPESNGACDPLPVASVPAADADVQTVCFYAPDAVDVPAAIIQQVVEIVGNAEWVHIRLTLNPDFVDNTYGDGAVGWEAQSEPREARMPAERARPRARAGHTFKDLLGSDHAELQLLDASGRIAMHFKLDYVSESEAAPSGFGSLGVSGGEGALLVGEPEWMLASTTSIDRNLNACALGSFTESSPATDLAYTPAPGASDWDYRVAYEIWVASEAFGVTGFGSALIENVHASPSKADGNTVTVLPAPCPIAPGQPEIAPEPVPPVLQNIR